jgi:GMC oxidoreductase
VESERNILTNSPIAHLVVGSGPTGYAAALSLLDAGETVFVIDPKRPVFPSGMSGESISAQKNLFGSTEMYRVGESSRIVGEATGIPYSETRGGLSATWGAGLQVFPNDHFVNWKCSGSGIRSAYTRLLSEIDHIYEDDPISKNYPWPSTKRAHAPSKSKLNSLVKNAEFDKNAQALFGYARLAITQKGNRGCRLCLGCLNGCPYDSIFNSGNELLRLAAKNPRLHIIEGFVDKIEILGDTNFVVEIFDKKNQKLRLDAMNIYLALGAIGTPALLLRSKILNHKIVVKDSQVFYSAYLSLKKISEKSGISLAQIFITNPLQSEDKFHVSLYSATREVKERIELKLSEILKIRIRIPNVIASRIVAGIGFIEPIKSGTIELESMHGQISISKKRDSETIVNVRNVDNKVAKELRRFRIFKIPLSLQIPEVGSGFHSGGGLYDFQESGGHLLDKYGSFNEIKGLKVCDASGMNFDIAGPHTLTAMAFAYRNAKPV